MLVSEQVAQHWFRKDSFMYKQFAYIFQNPLWTKNVPKGFSLCPFFWLCLASMFVIRPIVFVIEYIVLPILLVGGKPLGAIDKFIGKLIGGPSTPGAGLALAIFLSILLGCASIGIYAFCGVYMDYIHPSNTTIFAFWSFIIFSIVTIATDIAKPKHNSKCQPKVYFYVSALLIVIGSLFFDQTYSSCKAVGEFSISAIGIIFSKILACFGYIFSKIGSLIGWFVDNLISFFTHKSQIGSLHVNTFIVLSLIVGSTAWICRMILNSKDPFSILDNLSNEEEKIRYVREFNIDRLVDMYMHTKDFNSSHRITLDLLNNIHYGKTEQENYFQELPYLGSHYLLLKLFVTSHFSVFLNALAEQKILLTRDIMYEAVYKHTFIEGFGDIEKFSAVHHLKEGLFYLYEYLVKHKNFKVNNKVKDKIIKSMNLSNIYNRFERTEELTNELYRHTKDARFIEYYQMLVEAYRPRLEKQKLKQQNRENFGRVLDKLCTITTTTLSNVGSNISKSFKAVFKNVWTAMKWFWILLKSKKEGVCPYFKFEEAPAKQPETK